MRDEAEGTLWERSVCVWKSCSQGPRKAVAGRQQVVRSRLTARKPRRAGPRESAVRETTLLILSKKTKESKRKQ